jgi:hypothetical protein
VPARDDQVDRAHLLAAVVQIIVVAFARVADVFGIVVAVVRQAVRDERTVRFLCQAAHLRVVHTQDARAAFLHVAQELLEGLVDVLFRTVMVQMVVFDVRNDRNVWMEFEERAVAFVGFGHHPRTLAVPGVAAERPHVPADDDGRIQACFFGNDGNHGACRRLPVGAGYGHAPGAFLVQQFLQDVAAVQDRNAFGFGGDQFHVVVVDGAGHDDGIGPFDL